MTNERQGQMSNKQRSDDETQATKTALSKLKRAWKSVALLAVVGLLILGELAFQWAKHRGWTTYTTRDGLADNDVESIAVAPDGALWFGTRGVSRFDGETWTTYTDHDGLADNVVLSIAVAPDGALWFGTYGWGVSRFDGQTWTTYTEDDGLADNDVRSIAVAPDGALWFGTYKGGVSRFDGQTWTTYTEDDGLADNHVRSIAVAPDGALWFGTYKGGASRFDGQTWTTYTEDDGLADNRVGSIAVAPDGALWFGTSGGGVSRLDGQTWTTYTEDDGLANNVVLSIAVVPDGALWFGTLGGGVSRFDGETWTTYTPANSGLAKDWVPALTVDGQGRVWTGTQNGLSVFEKRVGLPVQTLQVLAQAQAVLRMLVVALVLLATVWIVRRKPKPARPAIPSPTLDLAPKWEAEKKVARRVYWWLLLSPFVTVPCFFYQVFNLYSNLYWRSPVEWVWAAVVPLIFHIPLLLMSFRAGSRFVRRHMQQALVLIVLQAGMVAISLNLIWIECFFFVNGALWLFVSLWGFGQVKRGDCWLMRWKGEDGELPRPWAVPADVAATPAAGVPAGAPVSPSPAAHPPFEVPADPHAAFERGHALLNQGQREAAVAHFLAVFRAGPPDLRRQALAELEKLGEVETH